MKLLISTGFALSAALCVAGIGFAQNPPADEKMGTAPKPMSAIDSAQVFKIKAQNGSGETGTAMLTQSGDSLLVKLSLTGGEGAQPAHIHKGTCAKLDPKPAYPLTTVSDGTSSTSLKGVKLSSLTAGTYAINVHKSTTDIKDYVACGDLTMPAK